MAAEPGRGGRPRIHSKQARNFSVKLEPAHFSTLDVVADMNGLADQGSALRHLIELARARLAEPEE